MVLGIGPSAWPSQRQRLLGVGNIMQEERTQAEEEPTEPTEATEATEPVMAGSHLAPLLLLSCFLNWSQNNILGLDKGTVYL